MNEEEIREEKMRKHKRVKTILKIAGLILLPAGLAFAIIGFVDIFGSMSDFEQPTKFWCFFIGFPMIAVGGMLTAMGFRREIASYTMRESAPVFNEAGKEIQPGIRSIAEAVKNTDGGTCPACGALNDKDSAFCKKCGAALTKKCPSCGADLDADAAFCDKCGTRL